MTNSTKGNQDNKAAMSFLRKNRKHFTFRKIKWLSLAIFGIYIYFDEVLLQQIKDVLWAIVY